MLNRLGPLFDVVVALALFIVLGIAVASGVALLPPGFRLPVLVAVQGVLVLAVVGVMLAWRARPWSDIGLMAIAPKDLPRSALALAGCLGANIVLVYGLYGASPETVELHSDRLGALSRQLTADMPLMALALVLAFVGFYEEVFARGFLLSRCRALMGGTWGPVLVSSVLFGAGHLYQGWVGVAQTTLVGVVLALLTLRWGTLWPAIIAHALLDILSVAAMSGMTGGWAVAL